MLRVLALVVVAAGCRIGFEARSAPDAGTDAPIDSRSVLPPRFVQTDSTMNPGFATAALAFPADVAAGNLLLVAIDYTPGSASTLTSVTDDRSNSYAIVGPFAGTDDVSHYLGYAIARAAGPTTVTATLSSAPATYYDLRLHEYTNVDTASPIQATASATGTTTASDGARSGPVTTTSPNELIFGFITYLGVGTGGTGFTIRSTFDGDITEDKVAFQPGVYEAVGTASGSSWTATVAAIRGN